MKRRALTMEGTVESCNLVCIFKVHSNIRKSDCTFFGIFKVSSNDRTLPILIYAVLH